MTSSADHEPTLIRSLWRASGSLVSTCALLTLVTLLGPVHRPAARALYRAWARLQCRIFRINVEVEQRGEIPVPCVLVQLNQASFVESIVYAQSLARVPMRAFVNIEYALLPFLGWAHLGLGAIPVVRQWQKQRLRALAKAERVLRGGESVLISIEGKRSADGLAPYKSGPVRMAAAADVPIVPVYFIGARESLPPGSWRVRPGHVRVVILPPVVVPSTDAESIRATRDALRGVAERALASDSPRG